MEISIAGKVTVLKAVIDSLPVYWFNLFKIPNGVARKIEKIRRDFFWQGLKTENKKLHFISWDKICSSKATWGVGLSSIKSKNISLLAKWWWKHKAERGKLWERVLYYKYGDWTSDTHTSNANNKSYILESIRSVLKFPQLKLFSNDDFFWKPGNGEQIKFWSDHRTNDKPLQHIFPRLYSLCLQKEASLASIKRLCEANLVSTLWRRSLRHWEEAEANDMLSMLTNFSPSLEKDRVIWKINKAHYNSKEGHDHLESNAANAP